MKHINADYINKLIHKAEKEWPVEIEAILKKCKLLKRLNLYETAILLSVKGPEYIERMLQTAKNVKQSIYGKRVVLFAPLYINNICKNFCTYCAFKADNKNVVRKKLTQDEIRQETLKLLKMGHKRVLMVSSEWSDKDIDHFVESIKTIYSVRYKKSRITRININCAPLSVESFKKLKETGIGTYQVFQETYHDDTYKKVHPKGPKSDSGKRIDAIDSAFKAGIDDVGIGVLYGLYDYKFETLALLMHIEYLEKTYNVGPHTISVPRLEPAKGVDLSEHDKYRVSDDEFKKVIAALRLSVSYTGMILSTRETPSMRDELFALGVSQISAASRTSPGGYSDENNNVKQFDLSDHRSLDDVIASLLDKKTIPSFCTACYRKHRTGETFMNLAKPGTIKGKCQINALITLKEYLDDFAREATKQKGYALIQSVSQTLNTGERERLDIFFKSIQNGTRDECI